MSLTFSFFIEFFFQISVCVIFFIYLLLHHFFHATGVTEIVFKKYYNKTTFLCTIDFHKYIYFNKLCYISKPSLKEIESKYLGFNCCSFYVETSHTHTLAYMVWFYGISTVVGYLMPSPVFTYIYQIHNLKKHFVRYTQ